MIAGDPDHGMHFSLSPGNTSDFTAGKKLIEDCSFHNSVTHLAMDKGYSSYEILQLCAKKNIEAVVPPRSNFKHPWEYNKIIYLYRNEIERLFNRLKNFRRVATRYDKLDSSYSGFVFLGMIVLLLKVLC
jgi:transposase